MASKAFAVLEQEAGLSASFAGRDLCSIADLTPADVAAILELGHNVKAKPENYRRALDAKQMVMFLKSRRCARGLPLPSHQHAGRLGNLCRPNAVSSRGAGVAGRYSSQP